MNARRPFLALAAAWLFACAPAEDGSDFEDEGPGEPRPAPASDEAPPFSNGALGGWGDPTAVACTGQSLPVALAAADARAFQNAARSVTEILGGAWPATPPSSAELLAYLGPFRGPDAGRFVGRFSGDAIDTFYLTAPEIEPVHVIAVLDLGPSIRSEVPVLLGALETMADHLAASGVKDQLSVVEWTDDAPVGVRLAAGVDAPAEVAGYAEQLRARAQFGGNPSLAVVRDEVIVLAEEGGVPAHVILLTDGSMKTGDPDSIDVTSAWRQADATVSVIELQGFDPAIGEPPPIHPGLLDDRRLADAGFYAAAAVVGDPARPSGRSLDVERRWQLDYLFGDRFDDLFRLSTRRARFEVSAPEDLGLIPVLSSEEDQGQTGLRRLGSSSVAFAQAKTTGAGCQSFEGKVRVLARSTEEPEVELAAAEVSFSADSTSAYGALLAALEGIQLVLTAQSCTASDLEGLGGKLQSAGTEDMDQSEAAAFEISRDRTLLVLSALMPLCK
ncbi:MAG: VWA domain-containing protein [Myxococcales bacterium]|nr:VWA domain-containing protein [Myxococcales bacterium]